jgi:hypothetical protein
MLQGQLRTLAMSAVDVYGETEEIDAQPSASSERARSDDGHDGTSDSSNSSKCLQRRAWEWALANRSESGELPVGAVIARRFNRSPPWGRLVKNAGLAGELSVSRVRTASPRIFADP